MLQPVKPAPLWPLFVGLGIAGVVGLGVVGLLAAAFYTGFHKGYVNSRYRASRVRGDYAYAHGNYQVAADEYTRMADLRPQAANGYGLRADCDYEMGRYTAAINDYTHAIQLGRGTKYLARLYYGRGNGYDARQDYAPAVADYTEALRLNPGDGDALRARVSAYQGLKDYAHAIQDADTVIASHPMGSDGFLLRAHVWQAQGNHPLAAADYRKAMRLSPEDKEAYEALAQMDDGDGRDAEAVQVMRAELQAHLGDAACCGSLGWWQYKAGDYEGAIQSNRHAISLDKGDSSLAFVWLNLGLCYAVQGDWARAKQTYTQVLPHCRPEDVRAGMNDLREAMGKHPAQEAVQETIQKSLTLLNHGRPVIIATGHGRQA